jgi:hypothetical protein
MGAPGFLSREERALGGICWVLIRFFFLEYFSVLLAVLGTPSRMTWLESDSDFSSYFFFLPPRRSPLVLERKSLIFLLLSPWIGVEAAYTFSLSLSRSLSRYLMLMIFSVLAVSGFPRDGLFPVVVVPLVFEDLRKELFLVEGSVGS